MRWKIKKLKSLNFEMKTGALFTEMFKLFEITL